jgi:hypothetical protein
MTRVPGEISFICGGTDVYLMAARCERLRDRHGDLLCGSMLRGIGEEEVSFKFPGCKMAGASRPTTLSEGATVDDVASGSISY